MKKITLASIALMSTVLLSGCSSSNQGGQNSLVECYGVSKQGPDVPLMMTKGMCDKLPYTKQVKADANDYVECYGVAAKSMNDCATNSSACGGSANVDRAANAWIAIPKGVCANLQGAVVGQLAGKAKKSGSSAS
ncbi:MAG: DUF2282 domain-containing protein [Gammaproteobacteria bacterium]|nr:DUF2282 domain-containing protein [Gammaproteobacteria bacterium]